MRLAELLSRSVAWVEEEVKTRKNKEKSERTTHPTNSLKRALPCRANLEFVSTDSEHFVSAKNTDRNGSIVGQQLWSQRKVVW